MRKAVAPPAMIKVAMIEVAMTQATTEPAIDVYVRAVNVGPVTSGPVANGLPASGQAKTDADQHQHEYCSRQYSPTTHRCPFLHPVVYIDVARAVAGSVGQYALACHLLVVRRDSALLGVRSTGRAFERHLQSVSGQTDRRGRIAAEAMRLAVGCRVERHDMGLIVWRDDRHRPCHGAIRSRDVAHEIVRRRLAGWQSGLCPVPVPPADERAALCPDGTGGQRDTESHDDCGTPNSNHCVPPASPSVVKKFLTLWPNDTAAFVAWLQALFATAPPICLAPPSICCTPTVRPDLRVTS